MVGEDKHLVNYFQAVLDRRDELEEEDKMQQAFNAAVVASDDSGDSLVASRPGELHPIGTTQL